MLAKSPFRDPTPAEKGLLRRLLAADFAGKDEIARQIERAQVRTIDAEGSLELKPSEASPAANVKQRIPVEGQATDEEGMHIRLLLHVVNGFVNELEVYKDDGSPIRRMPPSEDFELMVLPFDWPSKS